MAHLVIERIYLRNRVKRVVRLECCRALRLRSGAVPWHAGRLPCMQSRNMARLVIERIYLRGRAKRVVCFESCGGGKEVRVRHPDLYPSPCASQGNRVIPILPTKPRPFEDQQRTVNDAEEDALILWRNSRRVSTAVGMVSRDGIEFLNASFFVQRRTRGKRVPAWGFVCVEPIAHTAAECRGYTTAR